MKADRAKSEDDYGLMSEMMGGCGLDVDLMGLEPPKPKIEMVRDD